MQKSFKRCFVFCAGDFCPGEILPQNGDLVIAADGGLAHCDSLGIEPDYLVGDFDSVDSARLEKISGRTVRLPRQKDDTDTLAAVKLALSENCTEFVFLGALGGTRPEHSIANLQTLLYLSNRGCTGTIVSQNTAMTTLHSGTLVLEKPENPPYYISVFAMGGSASGVTIQGLQYPLENAVLTPDYPLGISNEFLPENSTAEISVKSGTLVVVYDTRMKILRKKEDL